MKPKVKPNSPEFEKFCEFTKRIVNVPKKEIDEAANKVNERKKKVKQDCK